MTGPVEILFKPTGTGQKQCHVRLSVTADCKRYGLAQGDISAAVRDVESNEIVPGSGTVTLLEWDTVNAKYIPTSISLVVRNLWPRRASSGELVVFSEDDDGIPSIWCPCSEEESSESESPSESDSDSESPSESDSESPSESDSDSESGSDSTPPSESGSEKSSAIVPAPWSPTGYAAWFVLEAPTPRFDDIIQIKTTAKETWVDIDPRVLDGIECDTLTVMASTNHAIAVGSEIIDDRILIRLSKKQAQSVLVTLRISAVRKGFAGVRLPPRTRAEFLANERFLRSAKPRKRK
jgi:hypothetical protein